MGEIPQKVQKWSKCISLLKLLFYIYICVQMSQFGRSIKNELRRICQNLRLILLLVHLSQLQTKHTAWEVKQCAVSNTIDKSCWLKRFNWLVALSGRSVLQHCQVSFKVSEAHGTKKYEAFQNISKSTHGKY